MQISPTGCLCVVSEIFLVFELTHLQLIQESSLDRRDFDLLGQIMFCFLKLKIKYAGWKREVMFFKGAPGGKATCLCHKRWLRASVEFRALY